MGTTLSMGIQNLTLQTIVPILKLQMQQIQETPGWKKPGQVFQEEDRTRVGATANLTTLKNSASIQQISGATLGVMGARTCAMRLCQEVHPASLSGFTSAQHLKIMG
jgi:hypothetical protein